MKKICDKVSECIYGCDISTIKDWWALRSHYHLLHTGNPVICDHCGKEFRNQTSLKAHKDYAFRTRQTCEYCGKNVPEKQIKEHIYRVHRKESFQFKCEECDLKVYSKPVLETHVNVVHRKLKPYVCDICGTKMAIFYNLNDHRLKVHGERFSTYKAYKNLVASGGHKFTKEYPKSCKANFGLLA